MTDGILIIAAYLLGSLSSAIIVCRLMGLPDPRSEGSNNPGATNVMRIGGKKPAAITLAGDSLKGFFPVLIANLMGVSPTTLAAVAMAAFLGHLYPLFFGFRGGKGVATALGVQFGLSWMIGGLVAGIWLCMAYALKISSLSALVSMALAPVIVWLTTTSPELTIMSVMMTVLLFWRHRSNIQNMLAGSEEKIDQ
ncbi:Acyl-phosphate:glycerol-3-phosphate O-acyltransferase PlsY (EC 2.3.1.n3) [hydrothermal vent metagenome]|uniref:Acyl-phosphate:glycerol-3-phosphate O-acyltransferase PlsY n=1 Tax=hydrothermal vent metagenome TaxID=652676 RepID=A0A3B1AWE9_9ZZZZ